METSYVLGFLIWYLIGASGFYYWWTQDSDLTTKELHLLILCGFMGVLSWIMGWRIHGKTNIKNITIFKKRIK